MAPDTVLGNNTKVKLTLIAKKAAENRELKFTSLIHLLNDEEYLYECFQELKNGAAAGMDERTKESYGEMEIRTAITALVRKLKARKYRPQPVLRVFIPKDNGKMRPLGIPTALDKVVQLACTRILELIFEPIFLNVSYGYRPNRNAHEALKAINKMMRTRKVNWVIDTDIKGFFDNVNHDWMNECLKQRISDPNFLLLIRRMLKAGVITDGACTDTEQGTPQGGIISPILANIYLHYVLDLWFEKQVKLCLKGDAEMVRYADDFVVGCQYAEEATRILKATRDRFNKFGLQLAENKTRIIEFGRYAMERRAEKGEGKPETFDFLGFTHYCTKTRHGIFAVRVRTSKPKYRKAVKKMKDWLKLIRNQVPLPEIWKTLCIKLRGHYQYYGTTGNYARLAEFRKETVKMAFRWLNRRSQKESWIWPEFYHYLERFPLPEPRIVHTLW